MKIRVVNFFLLLLAHVSSVTSSWEEWWTYDGISGPDYWGLLNPEWKLCNRGRRQSPIDVEPTILLYDPGLGDLHMDKHQVKGTVRNTGHSVILHVDQTSPSVVIHGGPLSYKYRVHDVLLHYGRTDDRGSEHTISGHAFPAELQILGYNYQLYENVSDATPKTQGIVSIALMIKLGNVTSPELRTLTTHLDKIVHKGQQVNISNISVRSLLPDTSQFMTYEGSTTMPGCHETVTWIILNKPMYISKPQIFILRRLMQGDEKNPKTNLANNFRPPQPLYNRSVRTNIVTHNAEEESEKKIGGCGCQIRNRYNPDSQDQSMGNKCFSERKVFYKVRTKEEL